MEYGPACLTVPTIRIHTHLVPRQGLFGTNVRTHQLHMVSNHHSIESQRSVTATVFGNRNIMRIASFEMLELDDIPASVSINEAVEIGKKYGTKDSSSFINGVLDRIHCQENME